MVEDDDDHSLDVDDKELHLEEYPNQRLLLKQQMNQFLKKKLKKKVRILIKRCLKNFQAAPRPNDGVRCDMIEEE
jgi:hypothetical protein